MIVRDGVALMRTFLMATGSNPTARGGGENVS